jgi:hypothetical protein
MTAQNMTGPRGPVFTVDRDGEDLQVIGASESGTAATVRALVYPGLAAAREVVIAVDGSTHGLGEFAHLAVGGGIARDRQAWALAVRLWDAVYRSRCRRSGGAYAWTRPRPGDPLVTLLVTEAAAVASRLSAEHHALIAQAAGHANPLGMRVVQTGWRPMADQWIGGRAWRDQVRVRLLHTMPDRTAVLIASQGLDTDIDLARMPTGRFAVVDIRHVVATQARAEQVSVDDVSALTQPAHLFPPDRTAAGREWDAYAQAVRTHGEGQVGRAGTAQAVSD